MSKENSTFESIIIELKNQGRKQDAINWVNSLKIQNIEKKIIILNFIEDIPYKSISYNDINLSISNLSRLKSQAIKSANKSIKLDIINSFSNKK